MHIRQAQPHETSVVANILSAAAAYLAENGNALWGTEEVNEAAVKDHVRAGRYHIALVAEEPVGVFRFELEDRMFWPEVTDGSSAFIHKIAVYPHKQGQDIAQALLSHACELARQHDRHFLRLDCINGRPKLRAIYERFGFSHHSVKNLGDRLFDRFEFEVATPKKTY